LHGRRRRQQLLLLLLLLSGAAATTFSEWESHDVALFKHKGEPQGVTSNFWALAGSQLFTSWWEGNSCP